MSHSRTTQRTPAAAGAKHASGSGSGRYGRYLTSSASSFLNWTSSREMKLSQSRDLGVDQTVSAKANKRGNAIYSACLDCEMYSPHKLAWAPSTRLPSSAESAGAIGSNV